MPRRQATRSSSRNDLTQLLVLSLPRNICDVARGWSDESGAAVSGEEGKEDPRPGAELQLERLTREVERLTVLAQRERGLIEAVLRHSPIGIILSDAEGRLVLHNEAAEKIWAGSATTANVRDWANYKAFHPDGRPYQGSDWSMARALATGEVTNGEEYFIERFDGTRGVLLGSSAPIYGADGEIEGALSIFADITEQKRQEEELRIASERYLTTLQSIGDAVIATDAGGGIRFMNPVAEKLTRWPIEEARHKPLVEVFRIVNEHTRATVESPVDKVIREGKIVGLANHTILIGKDGTEVAIDDSGAPIFDSQGNLAGVVLVFRDVGEKRREENRLSFMTEAAAVLASSLDYDRTLKRVAELSVPNIADWCAVDMMDKNGELHRLAVAHVDPEKVHWAHEIHEKYPPREEDVGGVYDVIRTGKSLLMEEIPEELLREGARDEEHRLIIEELALCSAMVVPLEARGSRVGAITFVSAESRRHFDKWDLLVAEELAHSAGLAISNAQLYREAQEANRAKDDFLATVSHELRTPLNAILGWANMLRTARMSSEKQAHALEVIERNARAQSQLIEDLLDVSRIISGNLRLEVRSVDLGRIIDAAVDVVSPAAESRGVSLEVLVDDDARPATGDPDRLQQIVWNLLSNAVKFTDRGGRVTIGLTRQDSRAVITVVDTGAGIDSDQLPFVFERFKQALTHGSGTRGRGGLGLGLAIVKHLVELHGGTVAVKSDGPGRGSMFTVSLPLAAVVLDGPARSVSRTPTRIKGSVLDGLRVLIVDDEDDARSLIAEILTTHGAKVTACGSAAEAFEHLTREPPDVLVSDIGMPGEDGYSFIGRVRAWAREQGEAMVPSAALTAYARMEDRTRAMLAGFHSHVAKPVEADELVVVVASLAGRTGGDWPQLVRGPETS